MFRVTFCLLAVSVFACSGAASSAPAASEPTSGEPVSNEPASGEPTSGEPTSSEPTPSGSGPDALASKRPPCQGDQSCNEDPSVSALWGHCTEFGVCECRSGFELSPTTDLCRPVAQ